MRTQQRPFVVEIKSSGRRSLVRQGSIWGATDLKAFVRQVEGDAPHLFTPQTDTATDEGTVEPLALAVDNQVHQNSLPSVPPPPASADTPDPTVTVSAVTVAEHVAAGTQIGSPKPRTRRQKRLGKPVARRDVDVDIDTPVTTAVAPLADELVSLARENCHLKQLWGLHLRSQNAELRTMLSRFGNDCSPAELEV